MQHDTAHCAPLLAQDENYENFEHSPKPELAISKTLALQQPKLKNRRMLAGSHYSCKERFLKNCALESTLRWL